MCIDCLKQVSDFDIQYWSPMYICFLDASIAFDKSNHWNLFSKLLDRNVPRIIVRILLMWYNQQSFIVQWNGYLSTPFQVLNGSELS